MTTRVDAAARSADSLPRVAEAARRNDGGDAEDQSQQRRLLRSQQQHQSLQDMREYLLHEYSAEPPPTPGAPARRASYDSGYHSEAQLLSRSRSPAIDRNQPRGHSADYGLMISNDYQISDDAEKKERGGRRELQRSASQRIRLRQMPLDKSLRPSNFSTANNSIANYGNHRGIKGRRTSSAGRPIKRSTSNGGSQSSLSSYGSSNRGWQEVDPWRGGRSPASRGSSHDGIADAGVSRRKRPPMERSNGGPMDDKESVEELQHADDMDDNSTLSEDLQFDNALRLSNRRGSSPGTPASQCYDSDKRIEHEEGANQWATICILNSSIVMSDEEGPRELSDNKAGNCSIAANSNHVNSITIEDLKFNNDRRRQNRRASMPNIGGCNHDQDKINPYSISDEDLRFDSAHRSSKKCNVSVLVEDLKFDNARRRQNGFASVPNIGGCNFDPDQDNDDSITNEDLQFDNTRRRSSASMPDISSMIDIMNESNHSTNSSSIMAEHIALKLKMAELHSELHKAQGEMKQLRHQNHVLKRRNAELEEQNYSYKKRIDNLERLQRKSGVIDEGKAYHPRAEQKRLRRRELRSDLRRNGSWKKPELDWGPLNESDRTPTLEIQTTTAKEGAEAARNAASRPNRRDKLKRQPSLAQAWWNRSALRRQDSLVSVATTDVSSRTGSPLPNPIAPTSSGKRRSPVERPMPRSATLSNASRHRARSKSWNLDCPGEGGSDRGDDILCHSTRTRRRRGAGDTKDDGGDDAEVPKHVEIPDLPNEAPIEDDGRSDLSGASASRPEGSVDGPDGAGVIVAGSGGDMPDNPCLSLVLLKPWQMMTKKGFG